MFLIYTDSYSALMAVCCSRSDSEERLVKCANLLIEHGALVNSHDRYRLTYLRSYGVSKESKSHLFHAFLLSLSPFLSTGLRYNISDADMCNTSK